MGTASTPLLTATWTHPATGRGGCNKTKKTSVRTMVVPETPASHSDHAQDKEYSARRGDHSDQTPKGVHQIDPQHHCGTTCERDAKQSRVGGDRPPQRWGPHRPRHAHYNALTLTATGLCKPVSETPKSVGGGSGWRAGLSAGAGTGARPAQTHWPTCPSPWLTSPHA